jgi:hypothetical protein
MTGGAAIPFTSPHVSLNRAVVADLAEIPVDDEVPGRTGFELLSVAAMTRLARLRAAEMSLPKAFYQDGRKTRAELPHFIASRLSSADPTARGAADDMVRRMGRNLGHLLLALHRGDASNRVARADWTDTDWDRWARVRRVWLAGGLTSGVLGDAILRHARDWLFEVGCGDAIDLRISPHRGATSLVGAARYLPHAPGYYLALDFGQTSAKRGLVGVSGSAVSELTLLAAVPSAAERPVFLDPDPVCSGRRQKAFIVDAICPTLIAAEERGVELRPDIMLCLAAYVDGGRVIGPSDYNALMELTSDVRTLLGDALAERTGKAYRIRLVHDGTAAAAVFAGQPDAAVIALGSALGVGFPPARADDLLNIEDLSLTR